MCELWLILVLSLLCSGCERDKDVTATDVTAGRKVAPILPADVRVVPGSMVMETNSLPFADIPDESVIVAVGNRFLTKRELTRSVDLLRQMVRVQSPTQAQFNKNWGKMQVQAWWDVVSTFIYQSALELAAEAESLKASESDVAAFRAQFETTAARLKVSLQEFVQRWTDGDAAFAREIVRHALVKAYFDRHFEPRLNVTDKDLQDLKKELEDGNRESAKTNALLLAQMKAYRAKTTRKDLEKLTGEDEEDEKNLPPGFKCEIFDNLARTALPDGEEVPLVLRETPLNSFTEPVELEDSIDVYFMTNAVRHAGSPTLYSGYRVYVPKDLGYLVPDDARLRSDIRARRNMEIVMPEIERLRLKFGTVLPYGECWTNAVSSFSGKMTGTNRKENAK